MTNFVPPLLLVDDHRETVDALSRFFCPHRPVVCAHNAQDTREVLDSCPAFCGAIFDLELPDGWGLDLVESFRGRWPTAPVMILTAHCAPAYINDAQIHGVEYAVKPVRRSNLTAFLQRMEQARTPSEAIEHVILQFAEERNLTSGEVKLLRALVQGVARGRLAQHVGVSENTIKSSIRNLLHKCDDEEDVMHIVRGLWGRALRY